MPHAPLSISLKLLLLMALGGSLGACAGLWDLSSAALPGTLLVLALSGFALSAASPKLAVPAVLAIAAGVLTANLIAPQPSGIRMEALPRGLISAAVSLIPAGLGAAVGAVAARIVFGQEKRVLRRAVGPRDTRASSSH